jgi:hypothetical protein
VSWAPTLWGPRKSCTCGVARQIDLYVRLLYWCTRNEFLDFDHHPVVFSITREHNVSEAGSVIVLR